MSSGEQKSERVIEIPTGTHGEGGGLQLTSFTPHLITLSLTRHKERSHVIVLNTAEAIALRDALNEFISELEAGTTEERP